MEIKFGQKYLEELYETGSCSNKKHRFQPQMSTTSKVFVDKKKKANTRRELNKKTREEW